MHFVPGRVTTGGQDKLEENGKAADVKKKAATDKPKRKKKKLNYKICLVALIAGLLTGFITYQGYLSTIDFWMTDTMFQPDKNPELDIAIIAIDEYSIQNMGIYENWKRDVYGKLIERICTDQNEPAVVAFDILFTSDKDPETDAYFAEQCARYGSVVTGIYLDVDTSIDSEHVVSQGTVKSITYPYDALNDAVAAYGFTNNELDEDGYFRNLLTQADYRGEKLLPLSLAAYKIYAEKNGIEIRHFADNERGFLFTYSTDSGRRSGFEVYSIYDVLYGNEDYSAQLDGKIVLVGAYALGFQDDFFTPADRGNRMFGVQIHANEIEAFHQNKLQVAANNIAISIIYGILIALLILAVYLLPLPFAGAVTAGALIIDLLSCVILYKNGIYIKIAYFILPAFITIVTAIVMHYLSARAEKAMINNAFKMYVAPEIVDEMATS